MCAPIFYVLSNKPCFTWGTLALPISILKHSCVWILNSENKNLPIVSNLEKNHPKQCFEQEVDL